ncbi:transcriptional repressor [Eubacteriales bacterium OttesenSCG-928-N14]|nr:transcriptional repressor [Eubacteriales bacterium OttesenSCG-928-N14]
MATRSTRQKKDILTALSHCGDAHITADELVLRLRDSGTPVSRSTVYRNLQQLEAEGKVKKYPATAKQPACYQFIAQQPDCHEHFHMICTHCHAVTHFADDGLQQTISDAALRAGMQLDAPKTTFYGSCSNCNRKGKMA